MPLSIPRRTGFVLWIVCAAIATASGPTVAQEPAVAATPAGTPADAPKPPKVIVAGSIPKAGSMLREPAVLKYDPATDTFTHQESILAPVSQVPRGGQTPYHGNRLHQFRYFGPVGTGGIYEAITEYQQKLDLNPRNYRYRFH